jgi:HAD superfamily hydrolase (TIGR01484 family)
MHALALATDFDGTLAEHGRVDEATIAALLRFRASGRKVVLVTGRVLDELRETCPRLDLFDRVVAENGALLYRPDDGSENVLAARPPESFVEALKARGVGPISVGRAIVATWKPHENTVLEVIRTTGLDLQVILNKRAVMILPTGVDKATGLAAALDDLGIAPARVLAVGDAENDHAFLAICGFAAAVANAVPSLQERADLITRADHGAGVAELIDRLLDGALTTCT